MLVFIVVLNLFVEYVPKVITESFTISIFTAVVLKLLIDAIAGLEHHVSGWFKRREGSGWRLLGLVTMFAILFFSKFVILEVIDIVFGDRVTLGGFIEVFVLVLTMILARLALTWTYRRLGEAGFALKRRPQREDLVVVRSALRATPPVIRPVLVHRVRRRGRDGRGRCRTSRSSAVGRPGSSRRCGRPGWARGPRS